MSKVFRVSLYIDNVSNENYNNVEDILNVLENKDLTPTLIKCEEKDTTDYLNKVGDDYEWNTTNEYERSVALHNLFVGDEEAKNETNRRN